MEYGVATVLYATALGTHDGQASHTHGGDEDTDGGEVFIGAGSAQMVSLSGNTIANSTGQQTQRTLVAEEIRSVPGVGMGANPNGPTPPRGKEPIAYSTRWRTRFHADGGQHSKLMADTCGVF